MKNKFLSGIFSQKGEKARPAETENTDTEKYFAVVHGGQGRMAVVVRDTRTELKDFLYAYCKDPKELEATGTCNKSGVINMTNPDKFNRKWLDGKIRNQILTVKEMFFGVGR